MHKKIGRLPIKHQEGKREYLGSTARDATVIMIKWGSIRGPSSLQTNMRADRVVKIAPFRRLLLPAPDEFPQAKYDWLQRHEIMADLRKAPFSPILPLHCRSTEGQGGETKDDGRKGASGVWRACLIFRVTERSRGRRSRGRFAFVSPSIPMQSRCLVGLSRFPRIPFLGERQE